MPLFEIAIIQKANKKELDDGAAPEKLIMPPKYVMAKDPQTAGLIALTGADAPKDVDLNRAEVLVRPFA